MQISSSPAPQLQSLHLLLWLLRGPAMNLGARVGGDFGGDLGAGVGGDLNEDLGAGVGEDIGGDLGGGVGGYFCRY